MVSRDGGETWAYGDLTVQIGTKPDAKEYDGIDQNADYRPDFGDIMDLAIDPANSVLYAATRGASLWHGDLKTL